ncbi:MAG: type II toxin-antitoxin system Phd/YefM family antitoxin [Bacteroidia bacterium]|nr:type II toxin-antitoxin system Phd/YefM family antitoxin [Bacteroidia bacterium]
MIAISLTALRARMKSYFDLVSSAYEVIVAPRNNREEDAVVMMSMREYQSLQETAHLLSTQANRERLQSALRQAASGETRSFDPGR